MNKAISPALLTLAALLAASPAVAQNAEQQAKMQPLSSAIYKAEPTVRIKAPEWAKNAALYELNTRQFTPEGTFKAAEQQLPRLKAQGVDVILDDRDARPGVMFSEWELIGVPIRVTIGDRGLANDEVEVQLRSAAEAEKVKVADLNAYVLNLYQNLKNQ